MQLLIYSLVTGTQVLLLALALHLLYQVTRVYNLALGAVGAAISYILYLLLVTGGISTAAAVVIALTAAIVFGFILFLLVEPFTKRSDYLSGLLVTLALAVLIEAVLAIAFGTGGRNFTHGILSVYQFGSSQIPISGLVTLGLGIIFAAGGWFFSRQTPGGRILRAIAEHPFAASSLGINDKKTRLLAYIFAAVVAGCIIALLGWNAALTPGMGFSLIVMAFVAFLVGGVSDIRGTIVASYLVAAIPELIVGFSPGLSLNWKMVLVFLIAALFLTARPQGIFATKIRNE